VLEFHGETIRSMSTSGRLVLCNMSVEAGATSGIVPADAETLRYLKDEAGVTDPVQLIRYYCGADYAGSRVRPSFTDAMIRDACCHSRGLGPEDPILAAAERFVGPDQIVAGHADSELGLQPAHRTGGGRRLAR